MDCTSPAIYIKDIGLMHTPIHIPYFNGFKYTHPHWGANTSEAGHRNIKAFPGQADSVLKEVRLGRLSDRASKKNKTKKNYCSVYCKITWKQTGRCVAKAERRSVLLTVFLTGWVNDVGFDGLLLLSNNSLCLFSERFIIQPWTAATPRRLWEINPKWYIWQLKSIKVIHN